METSQIVTVNASQAPAAIAFGPAWCLFVWVMRSSLIVKWGRCVCVYRGGGGSLKVEEQKAGSVSRASAEPNGPHEDITRRGACDKPQNRHMLHGAHVPGPHVGNLSTDRAESTSESTANHSDVMQM